MEYSLLNRESQEWVVQLFVQTFSDSEGDDEGALIGKLVQDFLADTPEEELKPFIVTEEKALIGAVFFSKIWFEETNEIAWLLSPMAVATSSQGKGVGQKLILFAFEHLKKLGADLTITYGDINFYGKVGYKYVSENVLPAPYKLSYPEGWIAQSLQGNEIGSIPGKSFCAKALSNPVYW